MKQVLKQAISFYRIFLAPFLGGRCRFYPSCSQYALEALARHPWPRAARLTARRLMRCHPLSHGGVDLVP